MIKKNFRSAGYQTLFDRFFFQKDFSEIFSEIISEKGYFLLLLDLLLSLCIKSKCGKIRTRRTLNMNIFQVMNHAKADESFGLSQITVLWQETSINFDIRFFGNHSVPNNNFLYI